MACGACGHDETFEWDRDIPGDQIREEDGSHYVTVWQTACEGCGAAGPYGESMEAAVDAWNRMWARRGAGEATRRVMGVLAEECRGATEVQTFYFGDQSEEESFTSDDVRAAVAELGLEPAGSADQLRFAW